MAIIGQVRRERIVPERFDFLNKWAVAILCRVAYLKVTGIMMGNMRYLGIDYGHKRIGVAVSDELGKFAFPLDVVEQGGKHENPLLLIKEIIKKNNIHVVVIGESKNLDGSPNPISSEIADFARRLQTDEGHAHIKIAFEPEMYTSVQAEQITGKNSKSDASAAAVILQGYLDRMAFQANRDE